jgi:hypothetical protein
MSEPEAAEVPDDVDAVTLALSLLKTIAEDAGLRPSQRTAARSFFTRLRRAAEREEREGREAASSSRLFRSR